MAETPPTGEGGRVENEAPLQRFVHDLNNVLAAALVNADLLQNRLAPESPLMEIAEDLSHSLEQARILIQELRASAPKLNEH